MTCIAGMSNGSVTCIGSDSLALSAWEKLEYGSKVIRVGVEALPLLIGQAGAAGVQDVLAVGLRDFLVPELVTHEWIVDTLNPKIKKLLKARGLLKIEHGMETMVDGTSWLVGARGALFACYNDFSVIKCAPGKGVALGHGSLAALGAFFALPGVFIEAAVKTAVEAAIASHAMCGGSVHLEIA